MKVVFRPNEQRSFEPFMCLDLETVIWREKKHPNTKMFKRTLIYYNTDTHYGKKYIKTLLSRLTAAKPGGPGVVEEARMSVPQRRSV